MKSNKIQILLGISSCALMLASAAGLGSELFEISYPDAGDPGTADSPCPNFS